MSDGAEVFDHLVAVHADACIADGNGAGFFVYGNMDGEFSVRVDDIGVGQQLELEAVERVGCIRDQLAQENLAVCIEGMHQDIEKLLNFGTKLIRLRGSVHSLNPSK